MSARPQPPEVSQETWRALLEAARAYRDLAPWDWMSDCHPIGVQTGDGRVYLVSVLGNLGECLGLAACRGTDGLGWYLEVLRTGEPPPGSTPAPPNALVLYFGSKSQVPKPDLKVYQAVGFKPSAGRQRVWPAFHSYLPGYCPWQLDQREADALTHILREVMDFAVWFRGHPTLYEDRPPNEAPFPSARRDRNRPLAESDLEWHRLVIEPPAAPAPFQASEEDLRALRQLAVKPDFHCELALFHAPIPIGDGPRPYYPKVALPVDARSGYVFHCKLNPADLPDGEAAGNALIQAMTAAGRRPASVRVTSPDLVVALHDFLGRLGVKVEIVLDLPMAAEARQALMGRFA